jgi:hypothetical protein
MPTITAPTEGTLESKSLWFHYKTKVWPEESPQRDVVHNAMRIFRSIRGFQKLGYASIPITTGPDFYELCRWHPKTPKSVLLDRAISTNFNRGLAFSERLIEHRRHPILFPANFEPAHQEWEQPHFQALWLEIISEMCTSLHLGDGWHLSNGCVEEYVHVMQLRLGLPDHSHLLFYNTKGHEADERERMRNIKVYQGDSDREFPIEHGLSVIETAVTWLKRNNFAFERMETALELLKWTDRMIKQGFYQ